MALGRLVTVVPATAVIQPTLIGEGAALGAQCGREERKHQESEEEDGGFQKVGAPSATTTTGKEGARTSRAPHQGTTKRLLHKHAKPRPIGRVLGRLCNGLGKIRGFRCSP